MNFRANAGDTLELRDSLDAVSVDGRRPNPPLDADAICMLMCTSSISSDGSGYVPLSRRTSEQLLASADELRQMASTATMADVAQALLTLADRYAGLAEKRRQDEGGQR
jgi:hypothetical protein